jgi:hypothetical protein
MIIKVLRISLSYKFFKVFQIIIKIIIIFHSQIDKQIMQILVKHTLVLNIE